AGGIGALVVERGCKVLEDVPGFGETLVRFGLREIVDLEDGGVAAVRLMHGADDEVPSRAAAIGTAVNELAGIGLHPLDQVVPGLWWRGDLFRIVGQQDLRATPGQAVGRLDAELVDAAVILEIVRVEFGPQRRIGADRDTDADLLDEIDLRILLLVEGGEGAVGDGAHAAGAAAARDHDVDLEIRIGLLEGRLEDVG